MNFPKEVITGNGVFIVAGRAIIAYSILARETRKNVRYK
jgi:hypothetical protein